VIYHHTDSSHLPYILQSGELRPGRNALGGFPNPDFLWATTDGRGDPSATTRYGNGMLGYRTGQTLMVRFRLAEEDFEGWPDIIARFPAWTPAEAKRLEACAPREARPQDWRCRAEPLPRSRWLGIDTKSYTGPWQPFTGGLFQAGQGLGVAIDGHAYLSQQIMLADGRIAYRTMKAKIGVPA